MLVPCFLPKGYTVLSADPQILGRCKMMLHLASCCSKRWELIESPLGSTCVHPLSVRLAGRREHLAVLCHLGCSFLSSPYYLSLLSFLQTSHRPAAWGSQWPEAGTRSWLPCWGMLGQHSLSPVNGEQGKHFPWFFILKRLFSICFCILFLKWAGH